MEVWIGRDGERHGPYAETDIRQWLTSGQVSREDLGWYQGLADWQPLAVLFPDAIPPAAAPTSSAVPPPLGAAPTTAPWSLGEPALAPVYAGFWKRAVAYILDGFILYLPTLLIESLFGDSAAKGILVQAVADADNDLRLVLLAQQQYYAVMWPALVSTAVMVWLYFALCESSRWQATLGKRTLGIRVTDLNGRRIGFGRALGRYAGKILSGMIVFIGFMMAGWTERKQALHDLLADTLVVNGRADVVHSDPAAGNGSNQPRGSFSA